MDLPVVLLEFCIPVQNGFLGTQKVIVLHKSRTSDPRVRRVFTRTYKSMGSLDGDLSLMNSV